jgi:exopolysaccharide production protein ExoQ
LDLDKSQETDFAIARPPPGFAMTLPRMFDRLEKALTAAVLILYSGGPFTVILSGGHSQGDSGEAPVDYPIMRLLFILTYALFAALLVGRWRQTLETLRRDRFTLLFVGLAACSVAWSASPDDTFSKSIAFIGTTLFGIYLAGRYSREGQLKLLAWAFGGIVCLSCIYAIALPQYGVMGGVHAGDWRGIYTHKNTLGKLMVLSVGVFLLRSLQRNSARFWSLLGLGASIMLIGLCTSKGAVINACSIIGIILGCFSLGRWRISFLIPSLIGLFSFALGSGLLISQNLPAIASFLNKDVTLTGRTEIWALTFEKFAERPWLGYGYYGFWQGLDSEAGDIWRIYGWETPNAHNGFLDIGIQLGFIGLSLFLVSLFYHASLSLIQLRQGPSAVHIWPLAFLAYMILGNLPESNLLTPNDLFWVLYVTLSLQPYKLRQAEAPAFTPPSLTPSPNLHNLQGG